MIRVKDDYVILVDENEYTVAIDKKKKDKKGFDVYKHLGYYSTLESALKDLYAYMVRAGLSEKVYDLKSAIEYVGKMQQEMKELISERILV